MYFYLLMNKDFIIIIIIIIIIICVLLAQWPHNAPTNSILLGKHIVHWAKYARYESETHKRQKYKWVISIVLKLR